MLEGRNLHGDAQLLEWLYQAKERCRRVEAEVVGYAKVGGEPVWHVAFPGSTVCGLVPASEAGVVPEFMPLLVGQSIGLLVKGLDPVNQVVACSRRDVVATAVRQALEELKVGDVRNAVVRAIIPARRKEGRPAGLLVEVARDVLVEVCGDEAATWLSLRLADQYVPGQWVRVVVQGIDQERGTVTVSVRSALPDPWANANIHPSARVVGYVYRVYPQRAIMFVEVRPRMVGLSPHYGDLRVRAGKKVVCRVKRYEPERRILRLAFQHVCEG